MHAGRSEARERGIGLRGEVDEESTLAVGDHHGRHAVREQVDLARERRVCGEDFVEQVVDRALHAVTGGLSTDDHHVRTHERLHEPRVLLCECLPVVPHEHFGTEHGVVLGERVAALDLRPALRPAHERLEHPRLVDHTNEGVAVGAEDGVLGPQVQGVLALALELLAVEQCLLLEPGVVPVAQEPGHHRARLHLAAAHHLSRDDRVRGERGVARVDPETREEDLHGEVGVHRRRDLRELVQVVVDELRGPRVVLHRSRPRTPTDVQRAFRETEVLLGVDEQQVDDGRIRASARDAVHGAPSRRLLEQPPLIGTILIATRIGAVVERGKRKRHCLLRWLRDMTWQPRGCTEKTYRRPRMFRSPISPEKDADPSDATPKVRVTCSFFT